jgi:uncharacterized protein YqhQ
MKKLPKKYTPHLTIFFMSVFMAFVMTFFVTAVNLGGFPADFLSRWFEAFIKIIWIVFPVIMTVKPLVEKLVQKITAES